MDLLTRVGFTVVAIGCLAMLIGLVLGAADVRRQEREAADRAQRLHALMARLDERTKRHR